MKCEYCLCQMFDFSKLTESAFGFQHVWRLSISISAFAIRGFLSPIKMEWNASYILECVIRFKFLAFRYFASCYNDNTKIIT